METRRLLVAAALLALGGCAGYQSASEFPAGRRALLLGDPNGALTHFQRIAETEPQYVARNGPLWESIWTYIGRSLYQSGKYAEAKDALEKGLAQHKSDQMGRLYLGLTLARLPTAPAKTTAFSVQEIAFALREGVEAERVAALVRERGVAFELSREAESQLKKAGADARLLDEIRRIRPDPAARTEPQTARAAKELAVALAGLRDDLDTFIANSLEGRFWDPGGELRKEVRNSLALVSGRDQNWKKIIADVEWLGTKFEEEIDKARDDESKEFRRDRVR